MEQDPLKPNGSVNVSFYSTSCHPHRKAMMIMISSRCGACIGTGGQFNLFFQILHPIKQESPLACLFP